LGLTHTQMPHDHWRVWKTARASDLPRVEPRSPKPSIANTASNASEWPGSAYEVSNHCRSRDCGRDAHYWAPPAQNRTCSFPASGSHLGCWTASLAAFRTRSGTCDTLSRHWVRHVRHRVAFSLASALRSTPPLPVARLCSAASLL